jgi:hypothetical protein
MLAKLISFGLVLGLAAFAEATVLTFDIGGGFTLIPADYGDRVVSTSQGGHGYGAGSGYTPNVVLDYAASTSSFAVYPTGYASLTNAMGHPQFNIPGELRLVPDAGYRVRLNSFSVAAWASSTYTADIRIWDDNGSFASPNLFGGSVLVPAGTVVNPLPAPVVGQGTVHLYSNIWGSIGLDNVDFNQLQAPQVPVFPHGDPGR